jgi:hypothetical protein
MGRLIGFERRVGIVGVSVVGNGAIRRVQRLVLRIRHRR